MIDEPTAWHSYQVKILTHGDLRMLKLILGVIGEALSPSPRPQLYKRKRTYKAPPAKHATRNRNKTAQSKSGAVLQAKQNPIDTAGYYAKEYLLTKSENRFGDHLVLAVGEDLLIAPKVRMEDIIGVRRKGRPHQHIYSDRNRIKSRHFDFVLCDLQFRPLVIIEVDDSSHDRPAAEAGDTLKNSVAAAVGIPLLRFRSYPTASIQEIRERVTLAVQQRQ